MSKLDVTSGRAAAAAVPRAAIVPRAVAVPRAARLAPVVRMALVALLALARRPVLAAAPGAPVLAAAPGAPLPDSTRAIPATDIVRGVSAPESLRVVPPADSVHAMVLRDSLRAAPLPDSVRAVDYLWVVRTALIDPQEIPRIVEQAHAMGVRGLLVQVVGRGDAYYRSSLLPPAEALSSALAANPDYDPLAQLVTAGARRGARGARLDELHAGVVRARPAARPAARRQPASRVDRVPGRRPPHDAPDARRSACTSASRGRFWLRRIPRRVNSSATLRRRSFGATRWTASISTTSACRAWTSGTIPTTRARFAARDRRSIQFT